MESVDADLGNPGRRPAILGGSLVNLPGHGPCASQLHTESSSAGTSPGIGPA